MEKDLSWLKSMIATRAHAIWDDENRPYYISYIAIDCAKENVDYKELIKPLKLRQWVLTDNVDGLKVVEHPRHKAKIGYVPSTVDFVFADVGQSAETTAETSSGEGTVGVAAARKVGAISVSNSVKTRRATLQFLETLSKLDDDELDQITIPVRTIVRLLNG